MGGEECHGDGSMKFKDSGETCHTSRASVPGGVAAGTSGKAPSVLTGR